MKNSKNTKQNHTEETERKVENLIDLVENKTRTDRHLEQYSDVGDPNRLDRARELQDVREEQIQNLKHTIVYGDNTNHNTKEQLDNLKENYTLTQGYINHNCDHIDEKSLDNLKRKQENRKEQMNQLQ